MQLFLADCQFPDIENQVKAYQLFVEAWENGEMAKSDKTDKFEMLFRVHAPGEGRVVCLCKAYSDKEIFGNYFFSFFLERYFYSDLQIQTL